MIRTIVGLLNSYYTDRDNKTKGALTMGYAVEVIKANRKLSDRVGGRPDLLRVAPYARVSTDTEEQLSSYKSQVAHYTDMVSQRNDWILVDIYADEAICNR